MMGRKKKPERRLADSEVQREVGWILDVAPGTQVYMKNLYDGRHTAFMVRNRDIMGSMVVHIRHNGHHLTFQGVEAMVREGWVID